MSHHERDHVTLVFAAVIGLFWAIGQGRNNAEQIGQCLRDHHLFVSASDAILILPDTDAGLDLARLVLLGGTIALVILVLLHHHRRRATPNH